MFKVIKAMKKFGLIGGIGPESTVEYYLQIIKKYREVTGGKTYPDFLIKSVDMSKIITCVAQKDNKGLIAFLKEAIKDIEKSGGCFSAIASNTPHIVFDVLSKEVSIPMISIVEETCKKTKSNKLKKVGLLGTISTMTAGFYQEIGKRYGLEVITPNESQMNYVHDKYINELLFRDIKRETKKELITIVNDLQEHEGIEGLILGGTELPLILDQDDFRGLKVIDTTIVHVEAIVDMMLSE